MMRHLYLLLTLCLFGCAAGPNYKPPKIQAPAAFAHGAQTNLSASDTAITWWRGFNDFMLNQLVDHAVASNLDLRIAAANLRQARASRFGVESDFLPVINAEASYIDALYSRAALFDAPSVTRRQQLYDAGFDASWELDLFGRVRRNIQAATATVQAAEANRRGVQVSLISEVARNYFELRGSQNELLVLRRNATNQNETLKITQARLEGGGGTELDVARARTELNDTLARIPPMEAAIAHAMHRLAVLTGQQPEALLSQLQEPAPSWSLPAVVAIGNPEQLLRRRPDIQEAERNLAAATAMIGVATADLFPRITFNGNIGLQATTFASLSRPGADTGSFGPSITWAALDYGHVRSRIKAAGAQADAQLAQFEKTVLTSLEETENTLVDYDREQARFGFLDESVKSSQSAANLAQERYDNGATDFLTVLDAERVMLEAQDQLAQSQTRTATALIAVYKALGGGWETEKAQPSSAAAR